MLNLDLLRIDIQEFINSNINANLSKLALLKNPFPEVDWRSILEQIEGKSKAKDKLPTWFKAQNIIYPPKVSIEQTSSEVTAQYKASLISGTRLIDLTGGWGIDDYYFSKTFDKVVHCEINSNLSKIAAHNFKQLNATNIECFEGDSIEYIQESNELWDWMYIDPSRRNESKGKVFMLKDCAPNVPDLLDFYFSKAKAILIKTAPLLDLTAGLSELSNVFCIHIVAVNNEVKELLWELHKDYVEVTKIKAIHINKGVIESFEVPVEAGKVTYGLPELYLYEPNSAIMKSGAFDAVSVVFNLKKLSEHSHLYTNSTVIDFPGRKFKIDKVINYNKIALKNNLMNKTANITVRNFPESVADIRKKWKIKEGGDVYCFFTLDANNNKIVLFCSKI